MNSGIAIDATVVGPPRSGVHYAVAAGAIALGSYGRAHVFTGDSDLIDACARASIPTSPGPVAGNVLRRIAWQQLVFPHYLRDAGVLFAPAYTAPVRCPIPYVVHVHDTLAFRRPELCALRNAAHMRVLMPAAVRRAKTVLVSSTAEADAVHSRFGVPIPRIERIPLGVDPCFLDRPQARPRERPYILFVGNLEPKKGVGQLLEAFQSLDTGDHELVIAGRYAWRSAPIRRALQQSGTNVVHLGYVPRTELPTLYAHAALTVMPSIDEGFGLPILEAMASGSPLLHAHHPVLCETSNGRAMTFCNNADLASQIATALRATPPTAENQEWARSQSWERWAQHALPILQAAI